MDKEVYRSAHGIKLFERKCTQCRNKFWVPKDSKQLTCSYYCKQSQIQKDKRAKELKK